MGTESTKKVLKNNPSVPGTMIEEAALLTSAGAADAHRIPALNAAGVLDPSVTNGKVVSAGAGDAGKLAQLDANGKLDNSVMPTGIGADVTVLVASEALAANDFVNIWNDAGTAKVRKTDAATPGKHAHGFVLAAVSTGANATVYHEGTNAGLTGLTPGDLYLSATTPGKATNTAPSTAGQFVQNIGIATSATSMNFERGPVIQLA